MARTNIASLNTVSMAAPNRSAAVEKHVQADGYAIISNVLDTATCVSLIAEIDRVEHEFEIGFGQNDFEGFRTRRIFNLISRGPQFRDLVLNEVVLDAVTAILGDDLLLSGTTSMHIGPGESEQLLHSDDGMITLPRPHLANSWQAIPADSKS